MNKNKIKEVIRHAFVFICAASIPALLILDNYQTKRYQNIEREVTELEKKQSELVEQNKQLITDISVLSSSDRIEKIAENELDMHKAESDEIVRVEMKGTSK